MGNTQANFLRIVPVKDKEGRIVSEEFPTLLYFRLSRLNFNTVTIFRTNDNQNQKSHFKTRPYRWRFNLIAPYLIDTDGLLHISLPALVYDHLPEVQHGGGLGSLFKSVARVVTPLVAQPVRYAGRTGLETGIGILSNVSSGENVKAATKRRASAAFQQTKIDGLDGGEMKTRTLYFHHWKEKKQRRVDRRVDVVLERTVSLPWFADDGYFWIKQRHQGPVFHFYTKCDGVKIVVANAAMGLEQARKHYASSHGGNSALKLFQIPPIDTSISSARWQPYYSESRIQRGSPIELNIETNPDYIDLSKCDMKFKLKITKANWTDIADTKVISINDFLHFMIKQMSIKLNNTLVTQQSDTYAYKAYMESLLSYPKDSAESYIPDGDGFPSVLVRALPFGLYSGLKGQRVENFGETRNGRTCLPGQGQALHRLLFEILVTASTCNWNGFADTGIQKVEIASSVYGKSPQLPQG